MNIINLHWARRVWSMIPVFTLFPAILLMSPGCKSKPEEPVDSLPRPVKYLTLEDTGAVKIVEFPGQIRAVQKSWKAFEVPGRVIERLVKEGEIIQKGQVLARLDPRDFQYAFDSAKARYEAAKAVEIRITQLSQKRAVSRQELDLARRDLQTAEAHMKQAQKALEDTTLVADFDGRVAQLLIDDFTNVKAKQDVILIQNNQLLEIVINVPESAIALPIEGNNSKEKVQKTDPVVIFSVLPGEEYPVVYREASERPDPATRTYEVKLTFTPAEKSLVRPGMTAKVRAKIPANPATLTEGYPIPLHALISDGKLGPCVWKINPDSLTVTRVAVTPGATVGRLCIVKGDLQNGDLIAVSGMHQLQTNQQVKLWQESPKK